MPQTDILRVQMLGGFRVDIGGRPVTDLGRSSRAAALLKLLLLSPAHRLHVEQVVDQLWSELGSQAAFNNLHVTLHTLRHILEPDLPPGCHSRFVELCGSVLTLSAPAGVSVDADEFQRACSTARHLREVEAYQSAVALYTGDLLPDDPFLEFATRQREALRQLHLDVLQELARLHEQAADLASAIRITERLLAAEPTHEDAHAALMRLYVLIGQPARAVRQYQLTVRLLRRELDVDPCNEIEDLYRAIVGGQLRPMQAPRPLVAPVAPRSTAQLTRREQEIAALVCRGYTNRQIALRLGISKRTTDTHVSRVLHKLGLGSRKSLRLERAERTAHTYMYAQSGVALSRA